jgi:hypothetical protein
MSTEEIVAKFESLSEDDQQLVIDFVDFHLARLNQSGSLPKGRTTTANDFDPPLNDFKE